MQKLVAFLRGINVGGKRKVLMVDLKLLFQKLGAKNVVTYIQSGNVVFDYDEGISISDLEKFIEEAIKLKYGFDVPVIVKTSIEIDQVISDSPYQKEEIEKLYLAFLKDIPSEEGLDRLSAFDFNNDEYSVKGKYVYLKYSEKASQSKLTNNMIENKLKVVASSRNWKTMLKLRELMNS